MVVYWDCLISCSVILAKKYENPFFVNNLDWGPVLRFASWKHCSQCGLLYDSPFSKHSYFGCQVSLASTRGSPLAARGGNMGEKWWPNGAWDMHPGFFYMPQICDMGPIILLPFRRKACWGFLSPFKNPMAWAGFVPTNLGIRGQHTISAPPKPLWEPLVLPPCSRRMLGKHQERKNFLFWAFPGILF